LPPQEGKDIVLALDSKLQYLAYSHLKRSLEEKAKAGGVVVLDASSGEVLALANLPTYNPNNRGQAVGRAVAQPGDHRHLRAGLDAEALHRGAGAGVGQGPPHTVIQTAPGRLTIGTATIGDAHTPWRLTVAQVMQKSSNVGTAKMALTLPPEEMWNMFDRGRLRQAPKLGFPGEVAGRLPPGQELAADRAGDDVLRPRHFGLADPAGARLSVFARDGDLVPLSLAQTDVPTVNGKQVFSRRRRRHARHARDGRAAGRHGAEGRSSRLPGGRQDRHRAQAGGRRATPTSMSRPSSASRRPPIPRLMIAVMIDEPSAGKHYGGDVAAPVFSQVMGVFLAYPGDLADGRRYIGDALRGVPSPSSGRRATILPGIRR
jgi:cell division protein FtsI (penicillin-binding protein 3)